MYLKKPFPILLIICITIFGSCQKELNGDLPSPTPPPAIASDSNYLDKIYFVEYSSLKKDSSVTIFNYDNLNRLISFVDSSMISPQTALSLDFKYVYYYNGTDTLPYKSRLINYYTAPDYNDTIEKFHFYDVTGKKIRDSILEQEASFLNGGYSKIIQEYSYGVNKIYGKEKFSYSNNNYFDLVRRDTGILNGAQDITYNQKYIYDTTTQSYLLFENSTHQFDNHPSPFAKLSNFKTWSIFPNGDDLFEDFFQYHQNVTYIFNDYVGASGSFPDIYDLRGAVVYNRFGYPESVSKSYPHGYLKMKYTYKSL